MKPVLPSWMVKAIVTTILGLLITGASAWGVHLSTKKNEHETRIVVLETQQKAIDKDLDEIKDGQKRMDDKLDRLLRRRSQ